MFLITSAAYVAPELSAEFGLLPPAFLPVGNRRLFVLQHREIARRRSAASDAPVYLSVPETFRIDPMDAELLDSLGIVVLPVPEGLTLGESVVYCLNVAPTRSDTIHILHGDTLIRDLPAGPLDAFSVGTTQSYYRWSEYRSGPDGLLSFVYGLESDRPVREVLTGYFAFGDAALLVRSITQARGDFIRGLNLYTLGRPLRPVRAGVWLDFGNLDTYYRSKATVKTTREFNDLSVERRVVRKSGRHGGKIANEAAWFRDLPPRLRVYTPAFLGLAEENGEPAYKIEHLFLPTLSDLYVFGRLPPFVWQRIFAAAAEFLADCARHPAPPGVAGRTGDLYRAKSQARLAQFARAGGVDPEREWRLNGRPVPSLARILDRMAGCVGEATGADLCVAHGDFCFSNVFYDFRAEAVRVIDPRGQTADGDPTIYGDIRYDVAKLHHSVAGRYDFILAGYYRLVDGGYDLTFEIPDGENLRTLERLFRAGRYAGHGPDSPDIQAITVLLFLSMLPLHADEPKRQRALLANALRLFDAIDRGETP